jgi:transcriptional regulator with XRE-family HTH domain
MESISKNLKLIRLVLNITQAEFGAMFNATKSMIGSYEKGKAYPDDLFIIRVAEFAGITETQLREETLKERDLKLQKTQKTDTAEPLLTYYPPTMDIKEERELIHFIMARIAKIEAKLYGISRERAFYELVRDATEALNQKHNDSESA